MAAGDVVVEFVSDRDIKGQRMVAGYVTLDGSNPTPVELGSYMSQCKGGVVSARAAAPLGADPTHFVSSPSGSQLLVEAYKITAADNGALIDSTNNTVNVNFMAWGLP